MKITQLIIAIAISLLPLTALAYESSEKSNDNTCLVQLDRGNKTANCSDYLVDHFPSLLNAVYEKMTPEFRQAVDAYKKATRKPRLTQAEKDSIQREKVRAKIKFLYPVK